VIIPVTNPRLVDRLIPLIEKLEQAEVPSIPRYLSYIKMAVPQEAALLLVDFDDNNNATSFLFAEGIISIGEKEVFIDMAYYDPANRKVGREMQRMVELWAKDRGCSYIAIFTHENRVKAYIKKYGFTDKTVLLRKKLEVSNALPNE